MKLGQLVEYSLRNIFVEKSYAKFVGETIPGTLPKKLKLSISLDQQCKILNSLSLLYANVFPLF